MDHRSLNGGYKLTVMIFVIEYKGVEVELQKDAPGDGEKSAHRAQN